MSPAFTALLLLAATPPMAVTVAATASSAEAASPAPVAATAADAAIPPAVPSAIDALVAEALADALAIAALRSELAARRSEEGPAAALPNPMLEASLQNIALDDLTRRWP